MFVRDAYSALASCIEDDEDAISDNIHAIESLEKRCEALEMAFASIRQDGGGRRRETPSRLTSQHPHRSGRMVEGGGE